MKRVILGGKVPSLKISLIPNWAPRGLHAPEDSSMVQQLKRDWKLDGKFVALYSGNLGRVHDLTPIMQAAAEFSDTDNVAIVFIGDGAQAKSLQQHARSHGLDHVHFHPAQPREVLNTTLSLGDVHFVSVRTGCEGFVYPSKLYGIFAVGKPVIFIGPKASGIAQTIKNMQLGECYSPNEPSEIANFIRRLKDNRDLHRHYIGNINKFAREHDYSHAVANWDELVDQERGLAVGTPRTNLN